MNRTWQMVVGMARIVDQVRRNTVALISLVVAVTSLGYNTWRNEVTEANRTVREAGFEMLSQLAGLQQVVLFARFMPEDERGDATTGWAYVIAVNDFAYPMPKEVRGSADALRDAWSANFEQLAADGAAYQLVDKQIEATKATILSALAELD